MSESTAKTAFDALKEQAEKIAYGEWDIKLIIYDGNVTGFDQLDSPKIKFRTQTQNKKT